MTHQEECMFVAGFAGEIPCLLEEEMLKVFSG